jgi:hypothetical protein
VFRISARTSDGRRFRSPPIEDDTTQEEAYEQFTQAVMADDLPDWLRGRVAAAQIESWAVVPGRRITQRPSVRLTGAVKVTVAVWPDPVHGFTATPAAGPGAGSLHAFGATEEEAIRNAALMLDTLRNKPLDVKSTLDPEKLDALRTKPAGKRGVSYFVVEVERGNRFTFERLAQ